MRHGRFFGPVVVSAILSGVSSPPVEAQAPVLSLSKAFLGGPAEPGGAVALRFEIALAEGAGAGATGIAFTDDLSAVLSGLAATGLPAADICGAGSQISGTSLLTFSGGSLPEGGLCSFTVQLAVPAGAAPGTYTNVTSVVNGLVGGSPVQGTAAQADLVLSPLSFAKEFTDDPAVAGATTTLTFRISNNHPVSAATGLTFTDDLDAVLPGLVATGLPLSDVCGAGSQVSGTSIVALTGANLAAGGTCTFAVTISVPAGAAVGEYPNQTSGLTGSIAGSPISIPSAADTLRVVDPLSMSKEFLDDPVAPGSPVSLRFTISNADASRPVTGVDFTDDLGAVLTGLVATGLPVNDVCGAGSALSGTSSISLSGGTLPAGGTCSFTVSLLVPAGAIGGTYPNVTGPVSGTIGGVRTQGDPASDALQVYSVQFTKSFSGVAAPGGTVGLSFTLVNTDAVRSLTGLSFVDDLDAVLPGLTVESLPVGGPCGPASSVSGTSAIALASGSLGPAGSCTFSVTLRLPANVAAGTYVNTTTPLVSGVRPLGPPAVANLVVQARIDQPAAVVPAAGGTGLLLLGLGIALAGVGLIAARGVRPG